MSNHHGFNSWLIDNLYLWKINYRTRHYVLKFDDFFNTRHEKLKKTFLSPLTLQKIKTFQNQECSSTGTLTSDLVLLTYILNTFCSIHLNKYIVIFGVTFFVLNESYVINMSLFYLIKIRHRDYFKITLQNCVSRIFSEMSEYFLFVWGCAVYSFLDALI